ncbi:hypothetical protein NSB24_23110, partial [Blautia coccoides]|uniref:hypothetical protein n=1 Tax=Blautia producta TaxID=33035 RepID=UPI00214A46D0
SDTLFKGRVFRQYGIQFYHHCFSDFRIVHLLSSPFPVYFIWSLRRLYHTGSQESVEEDAKTIKIL